MTLVATAAAVSGAAVVPTALLLLVFTLLIGGAFALRAEWDAVSLLTVYVVLLYSLPAEFAVGAIGAGGTPTAIFGFGLAVIWVLGRAFPRFGMVRGSQPVRIVVVLVVATVLASYAASTMAPMVPGEFRSANRGLFLITSMAGGALVLVDGVRTRERFEVFLRRLVIGGTVVAVLGIIQYALVIDITPWLRLPGLTVPEGASFVDQRIHVRRVSGTMTHAIEFGVTLALLLPLASYFAFRDWKARPRWTAFAPVVLMGVAIPLSVSRSAYLAAAVAGLVLVPTWPPRRRLYAIISAPFFAIGMSVVFPGVLGTIRGLVLNYGNDPSVQARTEDYERVPYVIEGHLWWGRGFRTFVPDRYFLLDNQWLMSLIETGVVGLGAMLLFFGVPVILMAEIWRRHRVQQDRDLAVAIGAALVAAAIAFGTFDALSFETMAGMTFLFAGAAGVHWRLCTRGS